MTTESDSSLKITTNIILITVLVVKLNLHSQYTIAHEATLLFTLTFVFQLSRVSYGTWRKSCTQVNL